MAQLRVRVMGGLSVDALPATALGSRKQRRLLAHLVMLRGSPVPPDVLADDLWPDSAPAQPRDQVAVLVSRLRAALPAGVVSRHGGGYRLDVAWCDIDALGERAAEASRRAAEGSWAAAAESARAALALVRGPVLPEVDDAQWLTGTQEAADRDAQRARLVLAEAELAVGDPGLAADLAREALALAPYDEAAVRILLEACLRAGRPAVGLLAYAELRERLDSELGVDPAAETRAAHDRLLRSGAAPATPLVTTMSLPGRTREIGLVIQALDRASRGPSRLLVVTGEAGIGKTRVLDAVGELAHAQGHLVVRARCDELGRVLPLQPVLDALSEALRLRTPSEIAHLLEGDAAVLEPLLGVSRGPQPRSYQLRPDGGTGQLLLQRAVGSLLGNLAGSAAVLLIVDDVHLADSATVALLAGMARRQSRTLALAATRVAEGPQWPAEALLEIGPLDLDAVAAVVGQERAQTMFERSGGHPLLLTELAAHDPTEQAELPESLLVAVSRACDGAGQAAATLRAASVLGPELDLDVLSEVLRRPAMELLDHLEVGVSRRLLVERETGFAFRHALVREALAADVGPTRRALLHRETARALLARTSVDPLVLAHHARDGGLDEVAGPAFRDAAAVAATRFAHNEVIHLADEALRYAFDPDACLIRTQALLAVGRYAEAAMAAEQAVQAGAGPAALQLGALAAHYLREWDRATELADAAAAQATSDPDRHTALAVAGHARHAAGDMPGAERRFTQLITTTFTPATSTWFALLRHHQGRSEEALQILGSSTETTAGLDLLALPLLHMTRALALAARGRSADALAALANCEAVVERLGVERYAGRVENCRGYILRNLGELSLADELNVAGEQAGAGIRLDEPQAHAVLDLAEGCLRRGDVTGALRQIERAEDFGSDERRHGFKWRHQLRSTWLRGRAVLIDGDACAAATCASEVVLRAGELGVARYVAFGEVLALHAALVSGQRVLPAAARRAVAGLTGTAGMEALWLTSELAQTSHRVGAEKRLTSALLCAAQAHAEALVAGAAPELRDTVRSHAGTRLESITV